MLIDATKDVMRMVDKLAGLTLVALHFDKWMDGRAYSEAVLLLAQLGFTGELIACGEVLAYGLRHRQRLGLLRYGG